MEKITDNEIIKALECCGRVKDNNCDNCPLTELQLSECTAKAATEALSLINRQKAEIEKWKKAQERTKGTLEIVLKNKDDRTIELEKAIKESIEFVKKQGELIEQLKAENDIHVKDRAKDIFKFTELASEINLLKMEKSEAVKEFAKRLKNNIDDGELYTSSEDYSITMNHINNLVKEMTEEDEGK